MAPLIYLASPYTHIDPEVRVGRYQAITEIAAKLIEDENRHVFGPITESHNYAQHFKRHGNSSWEFWKEHDELMLSKCDQLWVVMLPGWQNSIGVKGEIAYAESRQMPILFLRPDDFIDLWKYKLVSNDEYKEFISKKRRRLAGTEKKCRNRDGNE